MPACPFPNAPSRLPDRSGLLPHRGAPGKTGSDSDRRLPLPRRHGTSRRSAQTDPVRAGRFCLWELRHFALEPKSAAPDKPTAAECRVANTARCSPELVIFSTQPLVQVLPDECVVIEMRVGAMDAIDLLTLPGR